MFFISAWVNEDREETLFEERMPLLFLGRYLKLHNSKRVLNILFLDGYDRLSNRYISKLEALGFNVINFSDECRRLVRVFQ